MIQIIVRISRAKCWTTHQRLSDLPHLLTKYHHRIGPTRFYQLKPAKPTRTNYSNPRYKKPYSRSNPFTLTNPIPIKAPKSKSKLDVFFLGHIAFRLTAWVTIIYTVNTYVFEIIKCQGPSMMPTIQPVGEVIIIELFTHKLWGLDGGDSGDQRCATARKLQKHWEQELQTRNHEPNEKDTKDEQEDDIPWHEHKQTPVDHTSLRSKSLYSTLKYIYTRLTTGIHVGDVVVVHNPNRVGTVCKRVIGLPGDIVVETDTSDHFMQQDDTPRRVMDLFEENDNDVEDSHDQAASLLSSSLTIIPDGHIWLEGDNSVNSTDSRVYGPLPASLVIGKVMVRVWPIRGNAFFDRGGRPMPSKGEPFTGSTILPAGYNGEVIRSNVK